MSDRLFDLVVARQVKDARVLKLIRRFLQPGLMRDAWYSGEPRERRKAGRSRGCYRTSFFPTRQWGIGGPKSGESPRFRGSDAAAMRPGWAPPPERKCRRRRHLRAGLAWSLLTCRYMDAVVLRVLGAEHTASLSRAAVRAA
jgi:hypothetical protein